MSGDDDELLFTDDEESGSETAKDSVTTGRPWRILIVDDEEDIHQVTRFALADFSFDGRGIEFLHAHSGDEARTLLSREEDLAVVLLDVVMETSHAGLDVARWIREDLGNRNVRIILRTGQPGEAPERRVIVEFDINDYKEKSALTSAKLFTLMCTSLRGYQDIITLEKSRAGLKKIIVASSTLFHLQSFDSFAAGALEQLSSLLNIRKGSVYSIHSGLMASQETDQWSVVASTDKYAEDNTEALAELDFDDLFQRGSGHFVLEGNELIAKFTGESGQRAILYLDGLGELDAYDIDLIELYVQNMTIAFQNIELTEQLEKTQREIAFRLGEAAESRSPETGKHVKRVAMFCHFIGIKYGFSAQQADTFRAASPLHDVGKVGIHDAILHKEGNLDPEEWQEMKGHASIGEGILGGSDLPIIDLAATIARSHHEKWDGSGYPDGLDGEDIPVEARICAIVDVFDALASKRCYKETWDYDHIREYLEEQRGRHFEPRLVDIFMTHWDKLVAMHKENAD